MTRHWPLILARQAFRHARRHKLLATLNVLSVALGVCVAVGDSVPVGEPEREPVAVCEPVGVPLTKSDHELLHVVPESVHFCRPPPAVVRSSAM
jgi:hypothetical protein